MTSLLRNDSSGQTIDISALVELADRRVRIEYVENGVSNVAHSVSALVKERLAQRKSEAEHRAADAIVDLFELQDTTIRNIVDAIRQHRRGIDALRAKLTRLQNAADLACKTDNYLLMVETLIGPTVLNAEQRSLIEATYNDSAGPNKGGKAAKPAKK